MIRRYLRRHRVDLTIIGITIVIMLILPYIITTALSTNKDIKIYNPKLMGKYVSVKTGKGYQKMNVEEFIPCILYTMIPYNYEPEAAKTQIVIIRTYILYKMGKNNCINADELQLPYTTLMELEKMWGDKYEKRYNYTMKLIGETERKAIMYNGTYIFPYYHKLSAGITNNGEHEYLKSVESRSDENSNEYTCISYFTNEEIADKLRGIIGNDQQIGDLMSNLQINTYQNVPYVESVVAFGKSISGTDWQRTFGLKSLAFKVEAFSDGYKMTSMGIGNGKGVSLYGAKEMSKNGKTYEEIIKYYYSNVEIQIIE